MLGVPAHATHGARAAVDEPQYLLSAISLGHDGNLDISDELAEESYRPFHSVDLPRQSTPASDGSELSPHEPLLPALLALPVRLGGWVAAKVALALAAGAAAAVTAWAAIRRFGVARPVAVGVVAAFSLAAPLATYATQVYPELPAAAAVVTAVTAATAPPSRRSAVVLVVAVTALPWLAVKYTPVAVTLAGVAAWRWWRGSGHSPAAARRLTLVTTAVLVLSGIAFAVVHQRIYGGWTAYAASGYAAEYGELAVTGQQRDVAGRSSRIVGLLVDDPFGLAVWMPAWLLLPVAIGAVARRRPPGTEALVLPLAAGWLVATFVALTMHGWWWPGRQLVVVLPLAVIAVAIAAEELPTVRVLLVPGAVLGIGTWLWVTVEAVARRHVLVVDFDRTGNPWVRLWRLALPDGRGGAAASSVLLAAWTVASAVLAWLGWRGREGRPRSPRLAAGWLER